MSERVKIGLMVGGLALAALLFLLVGSAGAGIPSGLSVTDSGGAAVLQSNSGWSSGWVDIATDTAQVFTHNLGGDPDDYGVELWLRDTDSGGIGINTRGMGGLEAGGNVLGAHWQKLTDATVEVVRRKDDAAADQVRVNVWIPDPPVWDSGWVGVATDELRSLTHGLGGNVEDYTVGLWFKDMTPQGAGGVGINMRAYGGFEAGGQLRGAAWQNFTDSTIEVLRYADDPWAEQVRVRIFAPDPPSWDSGWVDLTPAAVETLTHNLGGNPNLYVVRGWQRDADGGLGINHRYIGGFEEGGTFSGSHWQSLTGTTLNVSRYADDPVADQVRFRIWLREFKVHLPLVLKAY